MKPARSSREVSGIERKDGLVEAPMRTSRQSPNTNRVLVQTEVVDRRPPIISLLLDHSIGRLRVADWANNFLARRCHHSGRDRPFLTLESKKTRNPPNLPSVISDYYTLRCKLQGKAVLRNDFKAVVRDSPRTITRAIERRIGLSGWLLYRCIMTLQISLHVMKYSRYAASRFLVRLVISSLDSDVVQQA
jgi:hypothetical protein